jgi:hypothetical protein
MFGGEGSSISISHEMKRAHSVYLGGHSCPQKFVQKLNEQLCPSKYTKWTLSISKWRGSVSMFGEPQPYWNMST